MLKPPADLGVDKLVTLNKIRNDRTLFPDRPSLGKLIRWCRHGVRGIRLEAIRVGRQLCTTRQSVLAFHRAVSDLDEGAAPVQETQLVPKKDFRRQHELAEDWLRDEGFVKARVPA